MPFEYSIQPDQNLVNVVASGKIDSNQALAVFDEIMSQLDVGGSMMMLSDHRALESVLPTEFVQPIVRRIEANRELFRNARWAFVESGTARYGMARMASILLERSPVELRVFRDIDKARVWLLVDSTDGQR
jgi:hypothetical protein